jgi:hypothetical protein
VCLLEWSGRAAESTLLCKVVDRFGRKERRKRIRDKKDEYLNEWRLRVDRRREVNHVRKVDVYFLRHSCFVVVSTLFFGLAFSLGLNFIK